ncbi:hypothetical protein V22_38200 [Calycomorphotria hydatis]|uniref:Lipopolysaccharide-assembly n=2 Tax=Calycomorphotria hydatis TaxID=2528027 RepID=A0A517TDU9_9PLAN|nr:hypothetical protein V22_38200 [Calycomorphotria hydatis]
MERTDQPSGLTPRSVRSISLAATVFFLASTLLGCGYTLTNGFDPGIRTVAVPIFKSRSFRRDIEYQLTEAVQREIQNRTPFLIAKESDADTRLLGRVVALDKGFVSPDATGELRGLSMSLEIDVVWEDLRDKSVIARHRVPLSSNAVRLLSVGGFVPETGQSQRTAEKDAVDKIARQVVDLMEMPW